jgi:superfamily II DNA or RNA helicase
MNINSTYFGQKGYTILKKELTIEQEYFIRKELSIKPFTQGSFGNNNQPSFPAYRESENKFYLPKYFGETHFGLPKEYKISQGLDISLPFAGEMRENQKIVVNSYLNHVNKHPGGGGGLLELPCAYGKTVLSLKIISELKKKTLVIVHKEFLMNQWIERIQQFLPTAQVGKIQGQIIDIENKDIVIGMLQSLSMKEYPQSMFDSFGLTIIDEVHHISSEVFSCALFKIVTKYMVGLSATMERKDGTTKVFKMFLGDVVYKGTRDEQHPVVVRAIEYIANDEDFNTVVCDFRGQVQYSTMISKLCVYNHRTEFILKIVVDMLKENPNQQIMILAHNRNLLEYLYNAIESRQFATVGNYLGGMKEKALKESESRKIIIATYSMAAEALDIKSLTTLIMATPKTEIEQCVGRILRERHGAPIVVDIIDQHQPFKNQWTKRKAFYKKQNYKIIQCSSANYNPDTSASVWKRVNVAKEKDSTTIMDTGGKCLIKGKTSNKQKIECNLNIS